MDFDRFSLSLSASRKDAAIAAFNSGSCSSEGRDLLAAAPLVRDPRSGDGEDDRPPAMGPIDGSKKPLCSDVVTSRMKTAATRPGFSSTKSV